MQDLRSESILQTQTPQKSKWKHLNTLNHSFKSVFFSNITKEIALLFYIMNHVIPLTEWIKFLLLLVFK